MSVKSRLCLVLTRREPGEALPALSCGRPLDPGWRAQGSQESQPGTGLSWLKCNSCASVLLCSAPSRHLPAVSSPTHPRHRTRCPRELVSTPPAAADLRPRDTVMKRLAVVPTWAGELRLLSKPARQDEREGSKAAIWQIPFDTPVFCELFEPKVLTVLHTQQCRCYLPAHVRFLKVPRTKLPVMRRDIWLT